MNDLTGLAALVTRARVLLGSAITWLTALAAIIAGAASTLEGVAGIPPGVTQWLVRAVAVIGVVIAQVRRVTPVSDEQKGLLPPKGPGTATLDTATGEVHQPDQGYQTLTIILVVLAIIALGIWIFSRVSVDDAMGVLSASTFA